MKKLFLAAALLCGIALTSHADDLAYRPFRVDAFGGVALSTFNEYRAGAMFGLEPKYALSQHLSVGLRGEVFLMNRDIEDPDDIIVALIIPDFQLSALATADWWFFPEKTLRPFVGAGLGAYFQPEEERTINGQTRVTPSKTNFGAMLRAGVDVWHVRLSGEYNFSGKSSANERMDYFSIKAAFFFGGGKK